jgi:hypothetical protein
MMAELNKLVAAGELHKAADLMKVQLGLLEQQIADASRRLDKIEQEDERRRNFIEATDKALAVACFHKAPEMRQ